MAAKTGDGKMEKADIPYVSWKSTVIGFNSFLFHADLYSEVIEV